MKTYGYPDIHVSTGVFNGKTLGILKMFINQQEVFQWKKHMKNMDILRYSCFNRYFQWKNSGYSQDIHDSTGVSIKI